MTEKRFISATYNNQSWLRLYLGENEYESYRPSELLDLLNGLIDENEQLKQRVSELECLLELDKLHKEVEEGKKDKFVELKLNDRKRD